MPWNVQAFPSNTHIDIGFDFTKIWYAEWKATTLVELDYVPIVEDMFKNLTSQSNLGYLILELARQEQVDLLLPLTDREEHDQYEYFLYINPFVKAPIHLDLIPLLSIHSPLDFEDNSNKETKDDLNTLVKNM